MLEHPFLRYAFLAGTAIALASGLVGYFVVLRSQVFSVDALSHVAFTGALAALAIGSDLLVGLYGACIVVALGMAALGSRGRAGRHGDRQRVRLDPRARRALPHHLHDVVERHRCDLGGQRALRVHLRAVRFAGRHRRHRRARDRASPVGHRPARSSSPASTTRWPPPVGCRSRALGFVFLGLVGVTAAAATQAVGALLLLGLLATPAGAAQQLTTRPFRALWFSAGIAVASMWVGLTIAYAAPSVPPSFGILAVATGFFLVVSLASKLNRVLDQDRRAGRPAHRI